LALWTAAVDQRIAATVTSGHFRNLTKYWFDAARIDRPLNYFHFMTAGSVWAKFDCADIGSLIAPRKLLIENGKYDKPVVDFEARTEYQRLDRIYRNLGLSDHLRYVEFEGYHVIDGEEAFRFLQRWLQ
jgi:hypothetical protein